MHFSEWEKIAYLAAQCPLLHGTGVHLGIGDDAAVLASPASSLLVWTIDTQTEGVHFRREWLDPWEIGWRAVMAAASDLAAMGARPWCLLNAWTLPLTCEDSLFMSLVQGMRAAANTLQAEVVGGNLSRGETWSLTTTLLGKCTQVVQRKGALSGDSLWLAGPVGLAAAGLRGLQQEICVPDQAVHAWKRPKALVQEGTQMASWAHAAIDVSDGLVQDVTHLLGGKVQGAVLDAELLTSSLPAGLLASGPLLGVDPLHLALYGGEDYALLAAGKEAPAPFRRIGTLTETPGLFLHQQGRLHPLDTAGFDHFRTPS